jgi:hypothetical protein
MPPMGGALSSTTGQGGYSDPKWESFLGKLRRKITSELIVKAVVALVALIGTWILSQLHAKDTYTAKLRAAPRIYVERLDELIKRGVDEGITNAIVNARAIVNVRGDLAESLVSMSRFLDTEIDELASEVGGQRLSSSLTPSGGNPRGDPSAAFATIQVLSRKWPSKRDQIEVEIRKLFTEMGLDAD